MNFTKESQGLQLWHEFCWSIGSHNLLWKLIVYQKHAFVYISALGFDFMLPSKYTGRNAILYQGNLSRIKIDWKCCYATFEDMML